MLFSSTTFIYLFLPIILVLYYTVFRRSRLGKNILLFLGSLFFYAWGEPKFVFVMLLSIVVNWFFGLMVHRYRDRTVLSKTLLGIDVFLNLALLFVFKYLGFTASVIRDLSGAELTVPEIALPIGISFFTFQALSYVVDVYRQKGDVQTNILYVGLYISFFPQLIAGPIVRYETIAEEIQSRQETLEDFTKGFSRFIVGLGKKVLLANGFALIADAVFDLSKSGTELSVLLSWLGALAYTFQIFFDFGGYSDMAIGLGQMFGFHFLENFNYPYISTSVSEFWRRWHISLGSWFRDYLYIPLGGNRVSKGRNICNLFIVWFATGLWHGANFTFIVWGLLYFLLLTAEKFLKLEKWTGKGITAIKWLYTMLFVIIGWVIFRVETISDGWVFLQSMFGFRGNPLTDGVFTEYFRQNIPLLLWGILLSTPLFRWLKEKTANSTLADYIRVIALFAVFLLSIVSLVSNSYNPFIYFNF